MTLSKFLKPHSITHASLLIRTPMDNEIRMSGPLAWPVGRLHVPYRRKIIGWWDFELESKHYHIDQKLFLVVMHAKFIENKRKTN
jgi:hypothetical protein